MQGDNMCKIPVNATFREVDGEMQMVQAEWAEIPADVIARFLIQKFGMTPIFGGDSDD